VSDPHATGSRAAYICDKCGLEGDAPINATSEHIFCGGRMMPKPHATPDRAARYFDTVAVDTVRWFPPHPQKHGAFFHVEPDSPESTGGSVEFQDADELDAFIAWLRERRIEAFGDA
jgi:hypothetical protein